LPLVEIKPKQFTEKKEKRIQSTDNRTKENEMV